MDCREVEIRLARALEGELGPAESNALALHLAGCAACRALEGDGGATAGALIEPIPSKFAPHSWVNLWVRQTRKSEIIEKKALFANYSGLPLRHAASR